MQDEEPLDDDDTEADDDSAAGDDDSADDDDSVAAPQVPQVSAGSMHSCALWEDCGLRDNGDVECWGEETAGNLEPTENHFYAIDLGGFSSCGVRPDGTIERWGCSHPE